MEFSGVLPGELLASVDPLQRPEDPVVVASLPVGVVSEQAFFATLQSVELATTPSGEVLPTAGNISPLAEGAKLPRFDVPATHFASTATASDGPIAQQTSPVETTPAFGGAVLGEPFANRDAKPAVALPATSDHAQAPAPVAAELAVAPARAELASTQPKYDGTPQAESKDTLELPGKAVSAPVESDSLTDDEADLAQDAHRENSRSLPRPHQFESQDPQRPAEFKLADARAQSESTALNLQLVQRSGSTTGPEPAAPQASAPLTVVQATTLADPVAVSKAILPNGITTEDAPLDLRQPEQFSNLATRIQSLADGQISEARIRLNPPELGELEIKLTLIDDETFVHLVAVQPAARELLESGLPRLRELLSFGGLELGQATVSGGERRESSAEKPSAPDLGDAEPNTELAKTSAEKTKESGRIDLYA